MTTPYLAYTFSSGNANLPDNLTGATGSLDKYISTLLGFGTAVAFIYFVFQFIIAGYGFLSSEGDKGKIELARHRMSQAILGLVVIVAAIFLSGLLGQVLGLGNVLDIESIFKRIGL